MQFVRFVAENWETKEKTSRKRREALESEVNLSDCLAKGVSLANWQTLTLETSSKGSLERPVPSRENANRRNASQNGATINKWVSATRPETVSIEQRPLSGRTKALLQCNSAIGRHWIACGRS